MKVPERAIIKEMQEHPWASRAIAKRIAEDHMRKPKTTTKEGKRLYQRNLMRLRRSEQRGLIPSLSKMNIGQITGIDLKKLEGRRK